MDILVIRHGKTDWNALNKMQGKADITLNEVGKNQAQITALKLKDEQIDIIISSPLKRALQTAEIINENKNVPLIIDNRISERDFGEFEGKETSSFDNDKFWSYKVNKKYEKAENIKDFFDRVYNFLDEIKKVYKDKRVLVVTHGGVSIPIKCYFSQIPDTYTVFHLCMDNCEVEKFENI